MEHPTDGGRQEDGYPTVHHARFDPETDNVTEQVLYAVAAVRGVEPEALTPLRTVVDPDALNTLFATAGAGDGLAEGELTFVYEDVEVTVTTDGEIRLRHAGQ